MTKQILILFLMALLSVSCGGSGGGSQSTEQVTDTTSPIVPDNLTADQIQDLSQSFSTNVDLMNFAGRESKMLDAIEIVKLVVATEEFKRRVLNHTYNGVKTFVDNRGFSNAQIYSMILAAAEKLQPAKNNRMDMEVEVYTADNNVVGYTYASVTQIWVNTKFFDKYTAAGVSHNLFHEWLHKLGFGHSSTWNAARDYSVPYAIGNIVGEIGKQFL